MADVVLLVEDDRIWRDRLEDWISELGCYSILTRDLQAGLTAIYTLRPTALVLDLRLRDEKQRDFLGWLLAEQAMVCNVPILIVTGYPDQAANTISDYEEGVVAFFDKGQITESDFRKGLLKAIQASQERKLPQGQRKLDLIRTVGKKVSQVTGADIPDPDTASIRGLLLNAFNDDELTDLCFSHFDAVYQQFAAGMTKTHKVRLLIEYCDQHCTLDKLLALVKQDRPAKYAEFEELSSTGPTR